MRLFPALLSLLLSCSLMAQMESRELVIETYLDTYNSQRASRDWAITEVTDVSFFVSENNGLVAILNKGETRIDLDRSVTDPMDGMFPLEIANATVILTNATVLFIAPTGENHFGFTLLDEPELPVLADGYITMFLGDGIGRRSVVE